MFSILSKTNLIVRLNIEFVTYKLFKYGPIFIFFTSGKELTLFQTTIFRLSKTEFADDNFIFDEDGRKFSKREENTVGKGEIARYEQFLLFPQCFRKNCTADTGKLGLVWEIVAQTTNSRLFQTEREHADDNFYFHVDGRKFFKEVGNSGGRGGIARYEQFLLFPPCFQKTCTTDT